uniref:Uncharacterized protein n=1 Tax=Leptosiphonia brodiei TaxID=2608611 RepID=A0A1Z1MAD7_9FLOR|nr:hypothetical protein [Leptosiphonia brodiei]ARW62883.1 hypothetical protein [Leptosiphonia brodiei]
MSRSNKKLRTKYFLTKIFRCKHIVLFIIYKTNMYVN